MSYVIAAPNTMTAVAAELAGIGSALNTAEEAAARSTLAVIPAAADDVSACIAHLFSQHAQHYQVLAGQAAAFQAEFVQHLNAGAVSYGSTEAANTALLQPLTAIAGSVASASAGLQAQLGNLLTSANALLGQLLNNIINFIDNTPWLVALILAIEIPLFFAFLVLGTLVVFILSALGISPF